MKVNKLFLGISIFAVLALFSGCASKNDDSVKEVVFDSAENLQPESIDPEEEQEISEANAMLVTSDEASAFQVEADASSVAQESKKNYTGWVSSAIRPITSVKGNIKLYVRPKKGTFGIFVMNENEKAVPVISSANEYTTTSFYLKAGNKIIKLCDDSNVVSAAKKTETGIRIRYTIEKVAIVMIDMECLSSKEGEPEDTVKISAQIQSQSKKKTDFSLKLLFDTVLGETDRHHFYTSQNLPVKNEVLYHSMEEEKWFVSKNAKACMQIILAGADISPIETVALANFATVDTKKWEADMTTYRSFDTVLSYNNSAVGIYWPKTTLSTEQVSTSVTFYISLAADGAVPGGADYILAIEEAKNKPAEEEIEAAAEEGQAEAGDDVAAPTEETVQNIQAVEEIPAAVPSTVPAVKETQKETPKETPKETVKETPKEAVSSEPETQNTKNVAAVQEITGDRLSYDYIQKLLDKIERLEEGDPEANKEEINLLNEELDAILNILNER